jgi:hypothetical protein
MASRIAASSVLKQERFLVAFWKPQTIFKKMMLETRAVFDPEAWESGYMDTAIVYPGMVTRR